MDLGMPSLALAPVPWPYSPEKPVQGLEGVRGVTAGHWMCQGGSQSCPLRQNVAWPQAWGGVMRPAMQGTRATKPHIQTPHRVPDSLSIPDLESHFPQD